MLRLVSTITSVNHQNRRWLHHIVEFSSRRISKAYHSPSIAQAVSDRSELTISQLHIRDAVINSYTHIQHNLELELATSCSHHDNCNFGACKMTKTIAHLAPSRNQPQQRRLRVVHCTSAIYNGASRHAHACTTMPL